MKPRFHDLPLIRPTGISVEARYTFDSSRKTVDIKMIRTPLVYYQKNHRGCVSDNFNDLSIGNAPSARRLN